MIATLHLASISILVKIALIIGNFYIDLVCHLTFDISLLFQI